MPRLLIWGAIAEEGTRLITATELLAGVSDVDGPPATITSVTIQSGNGSLVDNGDGTWTYTGALDDDTSVTFAYTASDGSLSSSSTASLDLTPVNDPPEITSDGGGATASVNVSENTTAVTQVQATDVDLPPDTLTYSILPTVGTDFALFSINPTTGELTFLAAPDFENPNDVGGADGDNIYVVDVQVSDGHGGFDTQTINVTVTDVAPQPASITTAYENHTDIGSVAGGDTSGVGYAIIPVFDWTLFTINPTTGALSFITPQNYESPSDSDHNGIYKVQITSSDGTTPVTTTYSIQLLNVNEAPAGADNTITINEDTSHTFSAPDFGFTDPLDTVITNSLAAVKITTLPTAGTLTLNGELVTVGQLVDVADIGAGKLEFTPAPDANGVGYASFTFQVQDNGGTANGGVDLDQTPNIIMFNVTPVNDPPTSTDDSVTTNEDTAAVLGLGDFGTFADVDGDTLAAVKITALPGEGVLQYDTDGLGSWTAVTDDQVIDAAEITAGRLRFVPDADENGSPYATIGFQVGDGTTFSAAEYTLTVNVTAVNDAPTSTDDTVTTAEDTAVVLTTGDFGTYSDVEGDLLAAVKITTLPSEGVLQYDTVGDGSGWTAVTLNQEISAADLAANRLRFVPDADENGSPYATIGFQVGDGTTFSAAEYTLTVNVTAVNDAPTSTDDTVTTAEDTAVVLTTSDFGTYSDVEGDLLAAVRITTLPTEGVLQYDTVGDGSGWTAVTLNQEISAADLAANRLRFVPDLNENGSPYATIGFQVGDGSAFSAANYTLTVNVTPVNDAPTSTNDSVTTAEDTAVVLAATDFGSYSDVEGDLLAAVRIATLPTEGVLQYDTVGDGSGWTAVALNQEISAADIAAGRLRFMPDANENGSPYATIGFQVGDGTAFSVTEYTLTVDVTAVNDAPVIHAPATASTTLGTPIVFNTTNSNAISISDVDASGGTETVTLLAANGTLTLGAFDGLSFSFGDGTSDAFMTFSGTLTDINAALDGLTFVGSAQGPGSLAIIVNDQGNTGSGPAQQDGETVLITVGSSDLTEPETQLDTTPPSITNSATATFIWSGSDTGGSGISRYVYSLDGGAPVSTTGTWISFLGLAEGSHAFSVYAVDGAGNQDSTPATWTWTVDTTAPTVTITDDEPGTANIAGGNILYTFEFSEDVVGFDASDVTVVGGTKGTFTAVDGNTYTLEVLPNSFQGNITVDVGGGAATDAAGNPNTAAPQSVQPVDTVAPAAPSTPDMTAASDNGVSNTDNITSIATPTFTGTAEAGSTITLFSDGTPIGTATADGLGNWTITSSALSLGSHSITAQATDTAGNTGPLSSILKIEIVSAADTTPPTITNLNVSNPEISFIANDPSVPLSLVGPLAAVFGNPSVNNGSATILTPTQQSAAVSGTLQVQDAAGNAANVVGLYLGTGGGNTGTAAAGVNTAMYGFGGNDTLTGNTGNDWLFGGAGNDGLVGGAGNDLLNGGAGNDSLNGGDGNDTLVGGAGNDSLVGGNGNDTYLIGAGDGTDTIVEASGGGSADRLVLTGSMTFSSLNAFDDNTGTQTGNLVLQFTANGGAAQQVTLSGHYAGTNAQTGVELINFDGGSLFGYQFGAGDYLISRADPANRNTGAVNLSGSSDNNLIAGENSVNDLITGGSGADLIFGGSGNDVLNGNAGNDLLVGGTGNDTLNGGDGSDWLLGGDGNDVLNGGDGNDVLIGGANRDSLTGGAGNDIFKFNATGDSTTATATADVILDFTPGQDLIDFSAIDANSSLAGDQPFVWGGNTAATIANSVTWSTSGGNTIVRIDTNGNATADMVIVLTGIHTLNQTDFIL